MQGSRPKGTSCNRCRTRRVRCTGEDGEACRACLRSAKFKNHDLSQVYCAYPNMPGPKRCSEEAADAPSSRTTRRRRKVRAESYDSTSEEEDSDEVEDDSSPPPPPKRRRPAPRAYKEEKPVSSSPETVQVPPFPSPAPLETGNPIEEDPKTSEPKAVDTAEPSPTPAPASFSARRSGMEQLRLDLPPLPTLTQDGLPVATSALKVRSTAESSFNPWSPSLVGSASPAFPSYSHSISSHSSTSSPAESPYLMDLPFDFGAPGPSTLVDDYFFGPSVPQIAQDPRIMSTEGLGGVSTPYWYGYSSGSGWPGKEAGEGKSGIFDVGDGMDGLLFQ